VTATQPQCGEPGYQRCPDCQAHRSERHLVGCPTLAGSRCHWCGEPMYVGLRPHDLIACQVRAEASS
jgi:hypothetical protein